MSFDEQRVSQAVGYELSQSLWNRAVSFDKDKGMGSPIDRLNPFGTGQCLSTQVKHLRGKAWDRLNPFGTGQCLSTSKKSG